MIKYIKIVLGKVAKRLSYIQDARCLKVNPPSNNQQLITPTLCCLHCESQRLSSFFQ